MSTLTDKEIEVQAVEMLIENLGLVAAERFISLMNRKGFDCTERRRDLWKGETIREISSRAMAGYTRKP